MSLNVVLVFSYHMCCYTTNKCVLKIMNVTLEMKYLKLLLSSITLYTNKKYNTKVSLISNIKTKSGVKVEWHFKEQMLSTIFTIS